MRRTKKLVCILLTAVMVVSMCFVSAFAEEALEGLNDNPEETEEILDGQLEEEYEEGSKAGEEIKAEETGAEDKEETDAGDDEWTDLGDEEADVENEATVTNSGKWGELDWKLDASGTLTISGSGEMNDMDMENGQAWTVQDLRTEIQKVVIEEGITSIGNYAFSYCWGITEVILPATVKKIGDYAFSYTEITYIEIPSGVSEIGKHAFEQTPLSEISIPSTVTTIGEDAFMGAALKNIAIPEGIEVIGENAFSHCNDLETANISGSVKEIGIGIFMGCEKLREITVDSDNAMYSSADGILFDKNRTLLICYPGGKSERSYTLGSGINIGAYAFFGNSNLEEVIIQEGIESIGESAFSTSWVKRIILPESIESIGRSAFSFCSSLESIVIPKGVKKIGMYAFFGCSKMESITIPKGVEEIGAYAFYNCSKMKNILVDPGNAMYSSVDGVLFNKAGNLLISYPSGRSDKSYRVPGGADVEASAFSNNSSLEEVILIDGTKNIGERAFASSKLKKITLPKSLENIGRSAFFGCSDLEEITVPGNIQRIEDCVFAYSGVKKVVLPEGVGTIGSGAFEYCGSLTDVTVPASVTAIEYDAFRSCESLPKVTVPNKVKTIGGGTFRDCKGLQSVYFEGNAPVFEVHEAEEVWYDEVAGTTRRESIAAKPFYNSAVTAYYPEGNQTWTKQVLLDYDGKITWKTWRPKTTSGQGSSTDKPGASKAAVSRLTISGGSKKIAAGKKVKLTVKISPASAASTKIAWKSSNTKYATVRSDGTVTVKKAGKGKTVQITALALDGSQKKAVYTIRGMKGIVKKVSIAGKGKRAAKAGSTVKLKAAVKASKGANKALKWTVSNSRYASVNQKGRVKLLKAGKGKSVRITAMATDGSGKKKSVTIRIK